NNYRTLTSQRSASPGLADGSNDRGNATKGTCERPSPIGPPLGPFRPSLLTADQGLMDRAIGSQSDAAMHRIDACLKATLGLS
ncbi:MAG: hypothetical protein J2P46_03590, partial [Zavarzinella sp.]|nr:hypothetical protein [Zavarzinella sp.]